MASSAAKVAASTTKLVSQEVLGAQCLLDYAVGTQVASSNAWRIYVARAKKDGASPRPLFLPRCVSHAAAGAWRGPRRCRRRCRRPAC